MAHLLANLGAHIHAEPRRRSAARSRPDGLAATVLFAQRLCMLHLPSQILAIKPCAFDAGLMLASRPVE